MGSVGRDAKVTINSLIGSHSARCHSWNGKRNIQKNFRQKVRAPRMSEELPY